MIRIIPTLKARQSLKAHLHPVCNLKTCAEITHVLTCHYHMLPFTDMNVYNNRFWTVSPKLQCSKDRLIFYLLPLFDAGL